MQIAAMIFVPIFRCGTITSAFTSSGAELVKSRSPELVGELSFSNGKTYVAFEVGHKRDLNMQFMRFAHKS